MEVYWGKHCQIYVTPTGPDEICLAVLTSDPQMRVERALQQFPVVARRLGDAWRHDGRIGGCQTVLEYPRNVAHGNVALVGDASFSVDGITGQGMSLAFQQALSLGDAFGSGKSRASTVLAHRRFMQGPVRMARLLLLLDRQTWLRRKVLRMLAENPQIIRADDFLARQSPEARAD